MRRRSIGTWLVLLIAIAFLANPSWGRVEHLSDSVRTALQSKSQFRPLKSVQDIPQSVVMLFVDHNGRVADVSAPWNATDTVSKDSPPSKRLIWAQTDGARFVVHYERGGLSHSYYI